MSQQEKFDRVLTSLHEAMLNDAHWPVASALIDDACKMKGSALVVGDGHSQDDARIHFTRFCYRGERHEERERWYFDEYFPHDERIPRLPQLRDSYLAYIPDLYTKQELKTSLAYNKALARGGYQKGLNVRLDGPGGSHIVWTLADSTEATGWGSEQIEMIHRLLPLVRQFVRVRHTMAQTESLGLAFADLFESQRVALVHLNRRGRIVAVNDPARAILRRRDGLRDQGGFLLAASPADNARLEGLLAGALPTVGHEAVSGSMTVMRSPVLQRLVVHVVPMTSRQADFGAHWSGALVLIVDPGSPPKLDARMVAATLDLSRAQSEVAVALAEGRDVHDIALATNREESTIRWHIKRMLRKQGLARQPDLVRLLLTTPGFRMSRYREP